MTISQYFNHDKNIAEQELFDKLSIETIQLSGVDVSYIPYKKVVDKILGESVSTIFENVVQIEAFMLHGGEMDGEGELMSKFGFAQRDRMDLLLNKTRWDEVMSKSALKLLRPREGDLIFIGDIEKPYKSQVNQMFEITHVDFANSTWSFGKRFNYKISLASWMSSHEKFNTGTKLDDVVNNDILPDMQDAINGAVEKTKTSVIRPVKSPLSNI